MGPSKDCKQRRAVFFCLLLLLLLWCISTYAIALLDLPYCGCWSDVFISPHYALKNHLTTVKKISESYNLFIE